jgi:hypothetical protein
MNRDEGSGQGPDDEDAWARDKWGLVSEAVEWSAVCSCAFVLASLGTTLVMGIVSSSRRGREGRAGKGPPRRTANGDDGRPSFSNFMMLLEMADAVPEALILAQSTVAGTIGWSFVVSIFCLNLVNTTASAADYMSSPHGSKNTHRFVFVLLFYSVGMLVYTISNDVYGHFATVFSQRGVTVPHLVTLLLGTTAGLGMVLLLMKAEKRFRDARRRRRRMKNGPHGAGGLDAASSNAQDEDAELDGAMEMLVKRLSVEDNPMHIAPLYKTLYLVDTIKRWKKRCPGQDIYEEVVRFARDNAMKDLDDDFCGDGATGRKKEVRERLLDDRGPAEAPADGEDSRRGADDDIALWDDGPRDGSRAEEGSTVRTLSLDARGVDEFIAERMRGRGEVGDEGVPTVVGGIDRLETRAVRFVLMTVMLAAWSVFLTFCLAITMGYMMEQRASTRLYLMAFSDGLSGGAFLSTVAGTMIFRIQHDHYGSGWSSHASKHIAMIAFVTGIVSSSVIEMMDLSNG